MTGEPISEPASLEENLESLMQRYQSSDAGAAALLVPRVSPQIFQYFLAQVRDRSRAEDLLQDFWLRIHHARRTYRVGEPVLPWLYSIARRVQIDDYRRRSKINNHELQTEELAEPRVQYRPERESGPSLRDLLKDLPAAQREAVLLLKVAGLSLEETARTTGVSVGAVKQRAHRAYQTLRLLFGSET